MKIINIGIIHNVNFTSVPLEGSDCRLNGNPTLPLQKHGVRPRCPFFLEENTDIEAWDAVIENNDELLEKYIAGEPISREKLAREEQQRVQDASLFPVYHGSAKNGLGIQPLMDAVTGLFQPIGEQGGAALCGSVQVA